jgi:RNA polymerase sigma factor (sigma-70 family)
MADDADLLRQYSETRSEQAFAELVRLHIGLVYHAALRICGDPHSAEDAAQAVFCDLARKAGELASRPALAGWLHTSARYAALRIVRAESRRRAREDKAHTVNTLLGEEGPGPAWESLRPFIDEALGSLPERDREAVLLRFFAGRAFADIGRTLSVTEDAARMRVDRALERMRTALARHGVSSTSAALGIALAAQAGAAVPAGVAAKVSAAALGAVSPAAVLTFMSISKLQVAIALGVAVFGATALVYQQRAKDETLRAQAVMLQKIAAENARLQDQNARLTKTAASAEAASASSAAKPALTQPRTAGSAAAAGVPLAAGLVAVETLGNAGRASARAAFATQLWAARTGDIALEATAITFGPEARARLEALAATLPDAMKAEYDTPEKLMAFMLAGSPHPVGGMQVLGETDVDADDVTLQTEWQHTDDPVVHQTDANFHQEADGWKLVVPVGLVKRASAYLSRTLEEQSAPAPAVSK